MTRLRLMVVTQDLGLGGAQRVLVSLLRHLDRDRFEPLLVSLDGPGPLSGEVPSDVAFEALHTRRASRSVWALGRLMRRFGADVVLDSQWHVSMADLVARRVCRPHCRVVCRAAFFHTLDGGVAEAVAGAGQLYRWARRAYPLADAVIAQTAAMRERLVRNTRLRPERVHVIPNPIDADRIRALAGAVPDPLDGPGPHLVAVGRLDAQKDTGTLLRAFGIFRERAGGTLTIVGEGPEEAALRAQAAAFGDSVRFAGGQPNPYPYLAAADVFVLSSRFEGFPGTLMEAHALGVRSVATDCPDGPREIVAPGRTGLLVPVGDATAMADAMARLMDPSFTYDAAAAEEVVRRHAPRAVAPLFEAVLAGDR